MRFFVLVFVLFALSSIPVQAEEGNPRFLEVARKGHYLKEDRLSFCDAAHDDFRALYGKVAGTFIFHLMRETELFVSFLDRGGRYRVSPLPSDFDHPLAGSGLPRWLDVVAELNSWGGSVSKESWERLVIASRAELLFPMSFELHGGGAAESPSLSLSDLEADWVAVKPLICQGDAILEDGDGYLPVRGAAIDVIQAETLFAGAMDEMPKLTRAQLHGSQLVHGSSSASLLAFTAYGGGEGRLIPTGQLEKAGRVPFCGEIVYGRGGVNQHQLSTVWVGALDRALTYAAAASWSPIEGVATAKELEHRKSSLARNEREIAEKRVEQWDKLDSFEKSLISESFPVLYGLKSSRLGVHLDVGSDVCGEVGLLHGAMPDEIRVIFVPGEKISLVRKILGRFPFIAVESIDVFDRVYF